MDALHRNEQTYEIEGEEDLDNSNIEGVETFDSNDTKMNTSQNMLGRRSASKFSRRKKSQRSLLTRSVNKSVNRSVS
mgnify:CR=1 FL=1